MIRIEDKDPPIVVAEKIVTATVTYTPSPLQKAMTAAVTGKQEQEAERDMFSVEEIREIADYLILFCDHHKEGEPDG